MRAALDMPAMLLAELTALGIELQAHGDRLRFRPKSAKPGCWRCLVSPKPPLAMSPGGVLVTVT